MMYLSDIGSLFLVAFVFVFVVVTTVAVGSDDEKWHEQRRERCEINRYIEDGRERIYTEELGCLTIEQHERYLEYERRKGN